MSIFKKKFDDQKTSKFVNSEIKNIKRGYPTGHVEKNSFLPPPYSYAEIKKPSSLII